MKYMLFAGTNYYPLGGALDLIGFYPSIGEAKRAFVEKAKLISSGQPIDNWGHIVKYKTMEIVAAGVVEHSSKNFYTPGDPQWFDPA